MKSKFKMFNMFGREQDAEQYARVDKFLADETEENWDDISSIIIDGDKTLWQAVLLIDREFCRTGRRYDDNGDVVRKWEKVPSGFTVLRAIDNLNKILIKRGLICADNGER
jgi:hypothetical protein